MKHKINKVILPASLLSAIVSGSFSQTQQPNIVIIHTDEHNFRTLGCYRECLQNEQAFPWGKKLSLKHPISIAWHIRGYYLRDVMQRLRSVPPAGPLS